MSTEQILFLLHRANVARWEELQTKDIVQQFLAKIRADRAVKELVKND